MARQIPDDLEPFERQIGEPARAFHGFAHYRDLGSKRSVVRAWRRHKTDCEHVQVLEDRAAPNRWQTWSMGWGWVARSAAWDAELDRQGRDKAAKAQSDAQERHARILQGSMQVLSVPIRALLDALQDPLVVPKLTALARAGNQGLSVVLAQAARCASLLPSLITLERAALKMDAPKLPVEDRREEFDFADRIAADPESTEWAIKLLDKHAGTGPGPAVGPGAPGEPGRGGQRPT